MTHTKDVICLADSRNSAHSVLRTGEEPGAQGYDQADLSTLLKQGKKTARARRSPFEKIYTDQIRVETIEDARFCPRVPEAIKITRYALEKGHAYQQAVLKRLGAFEFYAYLLSNPKGDSGLSVDCVLAPDQIAGGAGVTLSHDAVQKAGQELASTYAGLTVNGWLHGHSNFRVFHSGTDDENIRTVLAYAAAYQPVSEPCPRFSMFARNPFKKKRLVRYTYSIVVNNRKDTYGEVAVQNPCGAIVTKTAPIQIIEKKFGWEETPDPKAIEEEILTKIQSRGRGPVKNRHWDVG